MPEIRFEILPILGTKTDVPANDASLFRQIAENVFATHDVGPGYNFDVSRKRNACSKALGRVQWSKSANAQATKCLGLFELYDGTNREHFYWDNGKLYKYDSNKDPSDVTTAATTYQNGNADLVSAIMVGSHMVFTDREDGVEIQAIDYNDANAAAAKHQFTAFKARYLEYFARRIILAYTNQTNGDIDIRWSNVIPAPQTDCYFESSNGVGDWQLYVPNDDPIAGIKNLGHNACLVYCEDSINQMIYYPNFTTPFEIYTVVQGQGTTSHQSIISLGDRHFFFNKNYGFCEYRGGSQIIPISGDIEAELSGVHLDYSNLIVGASAPFDDSIMWTVPMYGEITPNWLAIYNYRTRQWVLSPTDARFLNAWAFTSYTWTNLVTDLTNAGYTNPTWNDLLDWLGPNTRWGDLWTPERKMVMGNTNGHLYQFKGENDPDTPHTGIRVEPIIDFGDLTIKKLINEIWFDIGNTGEFSIKVWHRFGDTVGELEAQDWGSPIDTVSCDSPEVPAIRGLSPSAGAKFHQIRWGNESNAAQFEVNRITLVAEPQGY